MQLVWLLLPSLQDNWITSLHPLDVCLHASSLGSFLLFCLTAPRKTAMKICGQQRPFSNLQERPNFLWVGTICLKKGCERPTKLLPKVWHLEAQTSIWNPAFQINQFLLCQVLYSTTIHVFHHHANVSLVSKECCSKTSPPKKNKRKHKHWPPPDWAPQRSGKILGFRPPKVPSSKASRILPQRAAKVWRVCGMPYLENQPPLG